MSITWLDGGCVQAHGVQRYNLSRIMLEGIPQQPSIILATDRGRMSFWERAVPSGLLNCAGRVASHRLRWRCPQMVSVTTISLARSLKNVRMATIHHYLPWMPPCMHGNYSMKELLTQAQWYGVEAPCRPCISLRRHDRSGAWAVLWDPRWR